jgi:hypothetical protein
VRLRLDLGRFLLQTVFTFQQLLETFLRRRTADVFVRVQDYDPFFVASREILAVAVRTQIFPTVRIDPDRLRCRGRM